MTTFGTVRCVNYVDSARTDTWRTNLPLLKGELFPNSGVVLYAVDPMNDGVDRRIKWLPDGPLYDDGSCQRITVEFQCKLAAGIAKASRSDGLNHAFYGGDFSIAGTAREIDIVDSSGTSTLFSHHGALSGGAALGQTQFVFEVPLKHRVNGPDLRLKTEMNLINGGFLQTLDANGNLTGGRRIDSFIVEEASAYDDAVWSIIRSRGYPEYQGGTKEDYASFWQEAAYRVSRNSRFVDVIWWAGNSFVCRDGEYQSNQDRQLRRRPTRAQSLVDEDEFTLTIQGPLVTKIWGDRVVVSITRTLVPGTGWLNTIVLGSTKDSVDPKYKRNPNWPEGAAYPPLSFTLCYDENFAATFSMSSSELATLDAYEGIGGVFADAGVSEISPVSVDWYAKESAYGPYGAVADRPGSSNIPGDFSTDYEAYEAAANLHLAIYQNDPPFGPHYGGVYPYAGDLHDRLFWHEGFFGFVGYGGATSGLASFHNKYWPVARAGIADMRAMQDTAYSDACRFYFHKEEGGQGLLDSQHNDYATRAPNNDPISKTDILVYNNRIQFGSPDTKYDRLGQSSDNPRTFPAHAGLGGSGDPLYSGNWLTPDSEHTNWGHIVYYYILSGDPAIKFLYKNNIQSITRNMLGPYLDGDDAAPSRTRMSRTSIWFNGGTIPRVDARSVGESVACYWLFGDITTIENFMLRIRTVYEKPDPVELGPNSPGTNYPYHRDWGGSSEASDYTTQPNDMGVFDSDGIDLVTHRLGICDLRGVPSDYVLGYRPWQAMMFPWHIYRLYRALTTTSAASLSEAPARAAALKEILKKICYGYVLYGFLKRPWNGNRWIPYNWIDWTWDPTRPGRAPDMSIPGFSAAPASGSDVPPQSTWNPVTGRPYCIYGSTWHFAWTYGTVQLAYEFAQEDGRADVTAKCIELLDPAQGGLGPDEPSNTYFGWGRCYNDGESIVQYGMIIPDPFKTRNSTDRVLRGSVNGTSSITGELYQAVIGLGPATLTCTSNIQGSLGQAGNSFINLSGTVNGFTTIGLAEPVGGIGVYTAEPISGTVTGTSLIVGTLVNDTEYGNISGTVTGTSQIVRGILQAFRAADLLDTYSFEAVFQTEFNYLIQLETMPAKNQSFETFRGNKARLQFVLTSRDTSTPTDILDTVVYWYLSASKGGSALVAKSTDTGITINGNIITVLLDTADTQDLQGVYYHELRADINGELTTLAVGRVTIQESIQGTS